MEIPKQKLTLAISPHINGREDIARYMRLVIYALLPATIFGIAIFGLASLTVVLACCLGAMLSEVVVQLLRRRDPWIIKDGSALLTGLLLALTLPPEFSWNLALLGAVVAIVVGKAVFGGLGYNTFNPALIGRAFLQVSFPVRMTTWVRPWAAASIDTVTTATPLALGKFEQIFTGWQDLFMGMHGGCIGETSILLLLLGALFLLYKKVIFPSIPLSIFISVAFWVCLFNYFGLNCGSVLYHFFSGGLVLGAFFMATDMVTSPLTPAGNIIFGLGIGTLVMLIRVFGGLPEGVMFSILFMNAFVPLINRHTRPRIQGSIKK